MKPRYQLRQSNWRHNYFLISQLWFNFKFGTFYIKSVIPVSLKTWVIWWLESLHLFMEGTDFSWTAVALQTHVRGAVAVVCAHGSCDPDCKSLCPPLRFGHQDIQNYLWDWVVKLFFLSVLIFNLYSSLFYCMHFFIGTSKSS